MCSIAYDSPSYKAEQEAIRKKEDQSKTTSLKIKEPESDLKNHTISSETVSSNGIRNTLSAPNSVKCDFSFGSEMKTNGRLFDSELGNNSSLPTAYGIMRRFIQTVKTVTFNGRIYVYDGRYFVDRSSSDEIKSMILDMFREEIKDNQPAFINNVVEYMKIEPCIKIKDSHIRTDIVSFKNGVIDLKTGELKAHSPEYLTMYSINAQYVPNCFPPTPYWDNYLMKLSGNNPELIERIYQMIGLIITPDTNAKALFLCQGPGNSGKSILIRLLEKLFASPLSCFPIQADKLKNQFMLSELFGRNLINCQDMPNEALDVKAVSVLKAISGNDTISSDVKFKSAISFHCRARVILTSNFAVVCKSKDDAFYSRLVAIPCVNVIPKSEQNPYLLDHLLSEVDGIVSKAIPAYFRLVQNGYKFAGDFLPNEAINFNENYSEDVELNIYNFAMSTFEYDTNGIVFTDDAHELYQNQNIAIARNKFSQIFKNVCKENFGAEDKKRYKEFSDVNGNTVKSKNALHCLLGIRFKSDLQ